MTTETTTSRGKRFVTSILPWIVAGGGLLIYLLTINPWVNFSSLSTVSRASGWTWQPTLTSPVFWLVTQPFSLLPASSIPLALNIFSAICGATVLWLLARSVSLLPHNRTQEQRDREYRSIYSTPTAWVPPLFAAIVCGLQLSFWESSTAISGEMFDLLLFALIIRCVLEYGVEERESWLLISSMVYGAAMANNWAMIAFFPLFLASLIRLKGRRFFRGRFLGRMFLAGAIGLSFYLLLPLVGWIQGVNQVGFWAALKFNLASQKGFLLSMPFSKQALFSADYPLWIFGLSSLLPILMMSIKWPSSFGDTSRLGVALATWILHIFHGVLVLFCVWVALDCSLSPRYLHPGLMPSGFLLLPIYYLGALSVGYFSAYFLLVFGVKPPSRMARMMKDYPVWMKLAAQGGVYALAIVATTILTCRNLPEIRASNSGIYKEFVQALTHGVPPKAVFFSDDFQRTALVQLLGASTPEGRYLTVDTTSLKWPDYHAFLSKKYPGQWTNVVGVSRVQPLSDTLSLRIVRGIQETNSAYYLHPSFGYFFETSYPESHGFSYLLRSYPTNAVLPPPMPVSVAAENEKFWSDVEGNGFNKLKNRMHPRGGKLQFMEGLAAGLSLPDPPNHDALALGAFYSRALVCWGVELQKMDQFKPAAAAFERALEINDENVVAQINLQSNQELAKGGKPHVELTKAIEDQFGKYRGWEQVMNLNGPFDEPTFCYEQGRLFTRGNLFRQAAQQFDRVATLAPENLPARLWLGQMYLRLGHPSESLSIVRQIKEKPIVFGLSRSNIFELVMLEASTLLAQTNSAGAAAMIKATLKQYPNDEDTLIAGVQAFMTAGDYTNALVFIEDQLALRPNNGNALLNKGFSLLQTAAYAQAIVPLSTVIGMKDSIPNSTYFNALLNRAISHFRLGDLQESQKDYESIAQTYPTEFRAHYGLAEIALRQKDTNRAIQSFELYLNNAPWTMEAADVERRLKVLRTEKR